VLLIESKVFLFINAKTEVEYDDVFFTGKITIFINGKNMVASANWKTEERS
jgi:hypothetical protein